MNSKNWILLKELVKTDFKLRYQGSIMGHLWSILKPLMLFSVMYLVFVRFLGLGRDMPHFAVALLLGMVIWNFFAETTSLGLTSIVGRGDLLRKLSFPKEIIVLSVAVLNQVEISKYAIIAPLYIIPIFAFSLGIAFILATLFVYFRDIAPVWEVVMQAGMYATPIIYSLSMIHNNKIIAVMMLNPLATIIQDLRHILIYPGNQVITEFINNKWIVAIPYVLPFIVLVFGYTIFKKYADKFAEII